MTAIPLLTSDELRRFSVTRALQSLPHEPGGRRRLDGLEGEFDREAERARPGSDPDSIRVPSQLLVDRQLSAGVQYEGAEVGRPPRLAGVIRPTRPFSVVRRLGAQVIYEPLPADIPRFTEPVTAEFRAERSGVDQTDSDPKFDLINVRGRTVQSTGIMTKMLAAMSSAEATYRDDMGRAVDYLIDRVSLWGDGTVDPLGILDSTRTGVGSVLSGGSPSLDNILQMEEFVAASDVDPDSLGYASTPGLRRKLAQTPKILDGESMLWYGDSLNTRPALVTTDLVADSSPPLHVLLYGSWRNLRIYIDPIIVLLVDKFARKREGLLEITLSLRADAMLERESAFCAIRDGEA